MEEETINKEISDALHMLLHCALKDKEFETQKEQFHIIYDYIKELEEENKKLKDNYKNQIEHTTILAKALNLEEDAPIDEIYAEINKLKTNSIPTSVIENKKKEEREKCVARFRYGNDEAPLESYKYKYTDIDMNEYAGSEIIRVLQEILEEGRR